MFWVALAIKHCAKGKNDYSSVSFPSKPFDELLKTFNCPIIQQEEEDESTIESVADDSTGRNSNDEMRTEMPEVD